MSAVVQWLRLRFGRRTRIYLGAEMFGPVMPWREVLARSTAEVPNPKERT